MENTSDYFMPRPLLFCMKSEKSVCYSVPDNIRYGIPFVYTSTLGMENENDNLFGEICYNITQTPQVWLDYQIQERQGALYLNWDYLQGLLDETQIENMIYKYSNLLDWLIENGDFLISEDNNYQEGIL